MVGKPPVAVFTKESPCHKGLLWQCFHDKRGRWRAVPIAVAQSIIGANAPRNMLEKGYAVVETIGGADCYRLTESGREWLTKGYESWRLRNPQ